MSCFEGCFSFISGGSKGSSSSFSSSGCCDAKVKVTSTSSKGTGTTSAESSKLVSALPPSFTCPPSRSKSEGRVSGKVRLKPGSIADPRKDLGMTALPEGQDPTNWFNEKRFLGLLTKLIGQAKYLQNSKTSGLVPQEERAAGEVVEVLRPYAQNNGGPLKIEVLQYVAKRPNVKITLPGYNPESKKTVGLIGSHLDVVPANPEEWKRNPFELTQEGDKLYGRGTTDCLGHVSLLTTMLTFLAEQHQKGNLKLNFDLVVVFIAAEEGGEFGVGIDVMEKQGALAELKPEYTADGKLLKGGPVYWIDSADSQPCCGTKGVAQWELKATGRLFHSGLPHKGINSIEFASEALAEIQERFYEDFPTNPEQVAYGFAVGSSMKPTQIATSPGSLNQIPPWCKISGDIRLVPFYAIEECMERVEGYVKTINENLDKVRRRGPYSKYKIDLGPGPVADNDVDRAKLELSWGQSKEAAGLYEGIACNLSSPGHKALVQATAEVLGADKCKPYSVSGSLPLVRMLQRAGYDLQIDGFGLLSTYHAVDEYCLLSDMKKSHEILLKVLALLNTHED